jgi:PAS domain-containing protein
MESVTEIHYRGKPAILGNSVDITEIKQAMQEVEERKSMETSILQAIPHTVVGFQDRHIIFVNESVETVFGWRPEEIIGQSSKVFYRSIEDYEEIGSTVYHALQS